MEQYRPSENEEEQNSQSKLLTLIQPEIAAGSGVIKKCINNSAAETTPVHNSLDDSLAIQLLHCSQCDRLRQKSWPPSSVSCVAAHKNCQTLCVGASPR